MVTPGPASIVVIPFPFSDLSGAKLRPAIVMADAGRGDWLLCQVTSNPYSDPEAIRITNNELQKGALTSDASFARPVKLFTANESVMAKRVAILKDEAFKAILTVTIDTLRRNMPK
ncbi:MAG: MazF family transcriptional regulator [Chloroflexota bacterium]